MLISNNSKVKLTGKMVALTLMFVSVAAFAQLQTAVQVVNKTTTADKASQGRVDRLSDQTEDMVSQYRTTLAEIESLQAYNQQVKALVNDQRVEIESMTNQMTELESTNRAIMPMVIEMVDMLRKLVEADIPFQKADRLASVGRLQAMLDKSNITTAEKYRKVTEAYQRELDYGRSVSTYQDLLPGTDTKVNFLQLGRTALLYQTLDEKETGVWNNKAKKFEKLDKNYNATVKKGLKIAAKQAAPNLVGLPMYKDVSGE